jgi:hypothetical protein
MTNTLSTIQQVAEATKIGQSMILALCAIATVSIAFVGLKAWRKELKGKSEYSRAKDLLKAVFKVRNAFLHVRHPAVYSYEYPREMRDDHGHLKQEKDYEGHAHVYGERWKPFDEAFKELEEQTLEAQVEWGTEFREIIVPLRKCRAELLIAVQDFLEQKKLPHQRERRPRNDAEGKRSVLYYVGEDSEYDGFTKEINAAVTLFENKLRPHIKN